MQKYVRFIIVLFSALGFGVLMTAVALSVRGADSIGIDFIWALAAMLFINMSAGFIIFNIKSENPRKSIWIKRIVVIGITCVTTPGCLILFHLITPEKFSYALYAGVMAAVIIVSSVILYIIADANEKKLIAKINNKLNSDG